MELDVALWSGLPVDMVERVLSFLPVPELCRYRSVCKKWNTLICDSKFGAAHARNAAKRDASYFVVQSTNCSCFYGYEGWRFLDLEARRWYGVKDDRREFYNHLIAAMDGGLVCEYVENLRQPFPSIIVYNPVTMASRELPATPGHLQRGMIKPVLHLVVDSISQQFKVFRFNHNSFGRNAEGLPSCGKDLVPNDPFMRVYDSETNAWKRTSTFPFCRDVPTYEVRNVSSVMFQGLLYAILGILKEPYFGHHLKQGFEFEFWRYKPSEDVWERVNVDIPNQYPNLSVSGNRLFLIGWFDELSSSISKEHWRLRVCEIKFPLLEWDLLFETSEADVKDVFGNVPNHIPHPEMIASGFGNSLLFKRPYSFGGNLMVLDLETRLWKRLPAVPVGTYLQGIWNGVVGMQMNLMLPSTLWWQEGQGNAHQDQSAT